MKQTFENKIKYLDDLIAKFRRIRDDYPKAGYGRIIAQLQNERAELANTIGKK